MKKTLVLLLFAVFTLVLIGCDSKKDDEEFQVDVFIYNFADTYIGGVRSVMEKELKNVEGVKFTFHDAANSQDTQSSQIDAAITKGTDLLVVNIVETGSGQTVVDKAKKAKLPIIFFNREVSDAVVKSYDKAVFVGTDPDEAGYMQGEMIADLLLAEGAYDKYDLNKDGKISYIMLRADLDNPEANGRTTYSVNEANRLLTAAGKPALIQIGSDTNCSWDTATAKTATASFLTSNTMGGDNPIELVIANNDDMALGAIQALNEVNYNTGNETKILVVGVDATATAQQAIKANKMTGSIKQDGEAMAKCLVAMMTNTKNNKDFLNGLSYTFEKESDKVRIPYAKFLG